jgi:hypothetical protein
MFIIHMERFSVVLAVSSDEGQKWQKHFKAIFYILILNWLHPVNLATHSVNDEYIILIQLISY